MSREFSTRQKARRSLQSGKPAPGRLGKRPVKAQRTDEKQRQGDLQRRHTGS